MGHSLLDEEANSDSLCLMAGQPKAGLAVRVQRCVTVLLRAEWPGWGCSEPLVLRPRSQTVAGSVEPGVKHMVKEGCRESRKSLQHAVRRCGA